MYLRSTHFRYAITYVFITFFVLLFLNVYSAKISQKLFYNSKESSMIEKGQLVASEIGGLEVFNSATVSKLISQMESLRVNQLIVTDHNGNCIYDSENTFYGDKIEISEVETALQWNDVFSWKYKDGSMQSQSATPIISYGALVGCVYMIEYDDEQGALIQNLQTNTLTLTFVIEIALIIFALVFSKAFTSRLQKIVSSMRFIREGNYSERVQLRGNDELTLLGNEFDDLVERLQTSEQKRQNFVSDASHELKTPLASIKLLTDSILQNDMDMDTVKEFVGDIGNEAERLNRMSQKLLSLSRIESQWDSDCEIIYMKPTIERALRMLSAVAKEGNVNITTQCADDCPILIIEDDFYQIVFNLIENGIKYNRSDGDLSICTYRDHDNAVLTVADSGMGIPEESLSHIFERFYRVDKARSRKSGGAGLGLSIVRNLVERNNGTIKVESTVGLGTMFTVMFPIFDTEE